MNIQVNSQLYIRDLLPTEAFGQDSRGQRQGLNHAPICGEQILCRLPDMSADVSKLLSNLLTYSADHLRGHRLASWSMQT